MKRTNMNDVTLTAKVSNRTPAMMGETAPTPTGKVLFEMIMPRGTKMAGMHAGVYKLGTVTLQNGDATLTVPSSMVLNMKFEILYKGNSMYKPSSVTPPMLTMSGLMGTSSSSSMGGMTM